MLLSDLPFEIEVAKQCAFQSAILVQWLCKNLEEETGTINQDLISIERLEGAEQEREGII